MDFEIISEVLKNSILITGLVIIMMMLIEYFNIQSNGKWFSKIKDSKFKQVLVGSLLGIFPGCIGGFAAVSLYTHKLLSIGALVAMTIATLGDESFFVMSIIPKDGLMLFGILFILSIIVGLIIDYIPQKNKNNEVCNIEFKLHNTDQCHTHTHKPFEKDSCNIFKPSKIKSVIIAGLLIFISLLFTGTLSHSHDHNQEVEHTEYICEHGHVHTHATDDNIINIFHDVTANVVFITIGLLALILIIISNEHFIKEHLWKHIIKEHLLTIFLWTFGALLLCQIGIQYLDIEHWISNNMFIVLLIAVLVGIIPESGPHMIFITLFAQGLIPFYILLANSIVQDGHSMLPLFAEDKIDFIKIKLINVGIGLLVGGICMII